MADPLEEKPEKPKVAPRTRVQVDEGRRTVQLSQCKVVVIKGEGRGREFTVAADVIRIGKAEDNDIVLSDETVSRVHCEILRDQKGHLLRDLKSTNGTFLD